MRKKMWTHKELVELVTFVDSGDNKALAIRLWAEDYGLSHRSVEQAYYKFKQKNRESKPVETDEPKLQLQAQPQPALEVVEEYGTDDYEKQVMQGLSMLFKQNKAQQKYIAELEKKLAQAESDLTEMSRIFMLARKFAKEEISEQMSVEVGPDGLVRRVAVR